MVLMDFVADSGTHADSARLGGMLIFALMPRLYSWVFTREFRGVASF